MRERMLSFKTHSRYWVTRTDNKVCFEKEGRTIRGLGVGIKKCPLYLANDESFKDFTVSKQMFGGAERRINSTLGIRLSTDYKI